MNPVLKLATFSIALALVFGAAALAGDTVGPDRSGEGRADTGGHMAGGEAGAYRVFADFKHEGEARTLAADLTVSGAAHYRALPEPAVMANAGDGYEVRLNAGGVRAGREAGLDFSVSRDGRALETEPYLGARGHLVALREGDLAFLHVHPDEDSLAFTAEFPTAGSYRLYLQFKHEGRVHTAEFTQRVSR